MSRRQRAPVARSSSGVPTGTAAPHDWAIVRTHMAGSARRAVLVIGLGVLLVGALLFQMHLPVEPPWSHLATASRPLHRRGDHGRDHRRCRGELGDAGAQIGTRPAAVRTCTSRTTWRSSGRSTRATPSRSARPSPECSIRTPAGRSPSLARSSRPAASPSRSVAETLAGLPRQGDRTVDRGNRAKDPAACG